MAEGDTKPDEHSQGDRDLSEGLLADVVIATAAGVGTGAAGAFVSEVTKHVLGREQPPERPEIELPPGVDREE